MIGFNCVHQPTNTAPFHCSPLLGEGGRGRGVLQVCAHVEPWEQKFLDLAVISYKTHTINPL